MPSSLDQLKATNTVVVSDSGDFASIGKYKPQGTLRLSNWPPTFRPIIVC